MHFLKGKYLVFAFAALMLAVAGPRPALGSCNCLKVSANFESCELGLSACDPTWPSNPSHRICLVNCIPLFEDPACIATCAIGVGTSLPGLTITRGSVRPGCETIDCCPDVYGSLGCCYPPDEFCPYEFAQNALVSSQFGAIKPGFNFSAKGLSSAGVSPGFAGLKTLVQFTVQLDPNIPLSPNVPLDAEIKGRLDGAVMGTAAIDPNGNLDPNTVQFALIAFGGPNIPTVSEWGLILLIMGVLASGFMIVLKRRRQATLS